MRGGSAKRTLSPRELGAAIGASESSVKRWVDAGRLRARLTSGGHRRIELASALRFLHETKREVVDPSLLGLARPAVAALERPDVLEQRLFELLRDGRRDELERELVAVFSLGVLEPAALFDGPLYAALARIGELWHGDHRGIYVEHRATVALSSTLDRLHALLEVDEDAPIAVGGSLAGDPGHVPTKMVAVVLARLGYRAVDLGADTPADALLDATDELGARLVWSSAGYVDDADLRTKETARLATELETRGVACVLGGRDLQRLDPSEMRGAHIGRSMRDLESLATDLMRHHGN